MFHLTSKIMNNKVCGPATDFTLVKEEGTRTVISYNLKEEEGKELAIWHELYFPKKQGKPSFEQAKDAIIADINERVKAKIIGGFVWGEKPVWLSEENQMNFSQAVTPVTLKIGEQEDGTPVYETFETKTALKNFNEACIQWKQQCLSEGWAEKDGIDWAPYAEALQPVTEEATPYQAEEVPAGQPEGENAEEEATEETAAG